MASETVYLGEFGYAYYAYSGQISCLLAKMLSLPRITVIEFGVAGGNGLLAMGKTAAQISTCKGVRVDVIAADQGSADLPQSSSYGDIVHWLMTGACAIDERLVLGEASKTLPPLIERAKAPIGFCFLDMDYSP